MTGIETRPAVANEAALMADLLLAAENVLAQLENGELFADVGQARENNITAFDALQDACDRARTNQPVLRLFISIDQARDSDFITAFRACARLKTNQPVLLSVLSES